jgi:hypothetical protein
MPEIRRLTNVLVPNGAGWETLPLEEALRRNLVDPDTMAEIEGAIVFFICVSAVLRGPAARTKLSLMLTGLTSLWGAQTTSSDVKEFGASLRTSMPVAPSGASIPAASSLPH